MKKRPPSATIIAILLGWLAVAGFVNGATGMMGNQILPTASGITALLAAIGLWKMRTWGLAAYIMWAIIALLSGVIMQRAQVNASLPLFAGFLFPAVLILVGGGVLVWKALRRGTKLK
jgi:hypothetical protein